MIEAITRLPGLVLMAGSAFAFSLMAMCIRFAKDASVTPAEIVCFRGFLCAILTLLALRAAKVSPLGNRRVLLVLRGVLGFSGLYLYSTAIHMVPLPDAMALQYTHPIFAAVFAGLFLKEKLPRNAALAIGICAVGAVVVINPQGHGDLTGNMVGLASGVASGLAYTAVRTLARTESPLVIMLSFHAVACVCGGVMMLIEGARWPNNEQSLWLLAIALVSQAGQWFLTHGLRKEKAGIATTVGYLAIAFGALWAWLFFDEQVTLAVLAGTALMITGLLLLARRR